MDLHLFDTSNYIYAGNSKGLTIGRGVREDNGAYSANDAPIGGVKFLLTQLSNYTKDKNNVVVPVFDSTPKIKREMYEHVFGVSKLYKGNRSAAPSTIKLQRDYAYQILSECGFNIGYVDNYEADDIIHTMVKLYKDYYENIYIHTRDSDLTYLVNTNVSIDKVGTQGNRIDIMNYELLADKKSSTVYNTVHINKWSKGDVSDNIPGVGNAWIRALNEIVPVDSWYRMGDLDYARDMIKKALYAYPDLPNGPTALSMFNLICPLDINPESVELFDAEIDFDKFRYFLNNWNPNLDKWGFENDLLDFINSHYE